MNLTRRNLRAYHVPALEKNSAGGDSPIWSGAEPLSSRKRLFCVRASSYGRPDEGSRKARRCSIGLSTFVSVAHPFDSGLAVTNRNWSKAMEKPVANAVDRTVASAINPLIGRDWTEDTLEAVASVVYEIGFMVAETELQKDNVFRVFELAAAALWWERFNVASVKNEMRGGDHA